MTVLLLMCTVRLQQMVCTADPKLSSKGLALLDL